MVVSSKKKDNGAHPFEYKDEGRASSVKSQSNAFKSFGTPKKEKKPFQYEVKEQQVWPPYMLISINSSSYSNVHFSNIVCGGLQTLFCASC